MSAITRLRRGVAGLTIGLVLAAGSASAGGLSPRPSVPRLAPLDLGELSEEQASQFAASNMGRTLVRTPELQARHSRLTASIRTSGGVSDRHREMMMLRMGWLAQAPFVWGHHARLAAAFLSPEETRRVAEGPEAAGWSLLDRAMLKAVDEIRYDRLISDATWARLRTQYGESQMLGVIFVAAQAEMAAMVFNSLGVQPEAFITARLPADVAPPAPAGRAPSPRLTKARVQPLPEAALTPEQRRQAEPYIALYGGLPNLYATILNNPGIAETRTPFGRYLMEQTSVPPRFRELAIMRTSWLTRTEYEWAHHVPLARKAGLTDAEISRIAEGPGAPGWSAADRAVLQAADDLRREAFVTDATWAELARRLDDRALIELVYTAGGYGMTGVAISSLGIQTEPGNPGFPEAAP